MRVRWKERWERWWRGGEERGSETRLLHSDAEDDRRQDVAIEGGWGGEEKQAGA